MVVVSHLFLFYGKISGADVTWYESHLPLFGTIYFPIAPINFFEMSERCNISPRFSLKFFGRCNISRTFGFYNTLINRREALKGVFENERFTDD